MYYPKSQIQTNLYSNGNEFLLDGRPYVGDYYKTSDGRYFTGKSPSNPPNNPLTENTDAHSQEAPDVNTTSPSLQASKSNSYYTNSDVLYRLAKGINLDDTRVAPKPPISSISKPTKQDYETGEFCRYFLKKRNEIAFLEVSEETYTKYVNKDKLVQHHLYLPIKIDWILTGKTENVFNTNKNIVALAERDNNAIGFRSMFRNNYLKFYESKRIEENLETDGTEFKNKRTGIPYSGKYHIHPEKGAMVGALHSDLPHDYLVPIEEEIEYNIEQRSQRSSGGY